MGGKRAHCSAQTYLMKLSTKPAGKFARHYRTLETRPDQHAKGPGREPIGSFLGPLRGTGARLARRLSYLPPRALQSGVVRDGRPMARKASAVMPSVWVTLSTRPTILLDIVPSALALTSVTNTEPEA